ncbi:Voltage-gated Ion Channel (VIC) Superfamily [Thraustotheca clavata]|uniref:Voltage-gated Ion Channel (VIC) Superfamily n=1 Tax=Thraustotheca clavata TaxID=74557 RepID=A0A1V9Y7X2_9STRA|nr:Voltage-gated Ion Channel (VIC) Superfamily [Thraustotheca clavata]
MTLELEELLRNGAVINFIVDRNMLEAVVARFPNATWVNDSFVTDYNAFNTTATIATTSDFQKPCYLLDPNPNCYTAAWELIWNQCKVWLLIQTPIFGVSILFEWLDLARNPHVEKLRAFWDSSFAHFLAWGVQLIASFYSCSAWVIRASTMKLDPATWTIESLLMGLCAFNYVLRWLGAKHKFYHVIQLYNMFDLLSIASHFSLSTTVMVDKARYSWLDMAFLRSYIIYYVIDALFHSYKSFHIQVVGFMIKAVCLVFFAAAVLYSLERLGEIPGTYSFFFHVYMCPTPAGDLIPTTNTIGYESGLCSETMSLFTSFYFMLVTVSTVGYGDFTPKTVLGRASVIYFIVAGIYTFAQETARLVAIYEDQRMGRTKYTLKRNIQHVILTGNPSAVQVRDFIREFFHPDHEALFSTTATAKRIKQHIKFYQQAHIVVLMEFQDEDVEREFQNTILEYISKYPQYHGKVTMLAGSPLHEYDLNRAKVQEAMAVFFMPNKYSTNANQEDAANVLRVLAVSNQKGEHTQLFAMLVNSENRVLLEATGIKSDHLVCSDEVKLGLMGLSCRCQGLSTLVSNLIGSFDRSSASISDSDGPLPLWADEYITGATKEIYSIYLDERYYGMTFTDATLEIFEETQGQILLIALENNQEVHCNPGLFMRITASSKVYVIADSMKDLTDYRATGDMFRNMTMGIMLKARPNLIARAERARHNVERAIPKSVRNYIDRFQELDNPQAPSPDLIHTGRHIIICSGVSHSGGQSISRLVNFLRPLRKDHVAAPVPVVIVDPSTFTRSSWAQLSVFGEVYHVQGSPQKRATLLRAGVYNASAIVVLDQGSEGNNDDSKAIFNAILIDAAIRDSQVFSIIELKDEHFNKFLDPLHRNATSSERYLTPLFDDPEPRLSHPSSILSTDQRRLLRMPTWVQDRLVDAQVIVRLVKNAFSGTIKENIEPDKEDPMANHVMASLMHLYNMEDNDTFFQERFMCGTLFPGYVADELLIQSFFNPSINVFMQHIFEGKNVFMLYDVPQEWRHLHLTYGDLFSRMTTKQSYALPIGLLRAPSHLNSASKPYVMMIISEHADLATPTGLMRTYVHRPTSGRHPTILLYSEIFQQTGPIERTARYVAGQGYVVLVQEVFHELNPIGTVLAYDDIGKDKGNQDKSEKDVSAYDTDNALTIAWAKTQPWCNGIFGAMGFCLGGHLAFRAAQQPEIVATACMYATDLHTQVIPSAPGNHSMHPNRLAMIRGELMFVFGRQDPHVPQAGRAIIYEKLNAAKLNYTWHEVNGPHAFMRDEGERYDAQLAKLVYEMIFDLFRRRLDKTASL